MRFRVDAEMPMELATAARAAITKNGGDPMEVNEYLARWIDRAGYMTIEFDTDGGAPHAFPNLEGPYTPVPFSELRRWTRR